jgi:hypothetical protein
MPTWYFKSTQRSSGRYEWYWEIESDATPIAISCSRTFATLDECIGHARDHGFFGTVDVPETITYPAFIACEAIERRANPAGRYGGSRANRPAR